MSVVCSKYWSLVPPPGETRTVVGVSTYSNAWKAEWRFQKFSYLKPRRIPTSVFYLLQYLIRILLIYILLYMMYPFIYFITNYNKYNLTILIRNSSTLNETIIFIHDQYGNWAFRPITIFYRTTTFIYWN